MLDDAINSLYNVLVLIVSLYGLHALILTILTIINRRRKPPAPQPPPEWPLVAVQLPLYNERAVAERIIDAVCGFDYPLDRLVIQVLDDSTDGSTEIVQQKVIHYRALGFNIQLLHRANREGYKAGALQAATQQLEAEFIAIFDADFLPDPGYLKQTLPYFTNHPRLGMVQARWGHLNRAQNLLTGAQALFLDGHHLVEQVGRSRSGLMLNFNGTCGVWRAECVRDAGGWQGDTLSEDVDLSLRAQLKGWQLTYLPELVVPGEIPPTVSIFKRQQYRWNFGYAQVMKKFLLRLWTTPGIPFFQRLFASFQVSANLVQLAGFLIFLLALPLVLLDPEQPSTLAWISAAASGPMVLVAIGQVFGYRDGFLNLVRRLLYLPILLALTIGSAATNARGVLLALLGKKGVFTRTPKFNTLASAGAVPVHATGGGKGGGVGNIHIDIWIEIAIAVYLAICLSLALQRHVPEMVPLTTIGMLSFGFTGFYGLVENSRPADPRRVEVEMVRQ